MMTEKSPGKSLSERYWKLVDDEKVFISDDDPVSNAYYAVVDASEIIHTRGALEQVMFEFNQTVNTLDSLLTERESITPPLRTGLVKAPK